MLDTFGRWRKRHPQSYCDAYVSGNLATIAALFVRQGLLLWNPLCRDGSGMPDNDIETHDW